MARGGKAEAPPTHGVGGGVVSAKPQGHVGGGVTSRKKPDLAVSMKQMLRRKGGSK